MPGDLTPRYKRGVAGSHAKPRNFGGTVANVLHRPLGR